MSEQSSHQELFLQTSSTNIDPKKEETIHEIQRQLVEEIFNKLNDPRAYTIQYPGEWPGQIVHGGANPNWEQGSQLRFITLDNSARFNFRGRRDEICVSAINNKGRYTQTRGHSTMQMARGEESAREIVLTRFMQTLSQKAKGEGTAYILILSENVRHFSGTDSMKTEVYPFRTKPNVPTFAERWEHGSAQLASIGVYTISGNDSDLTENDYREILSALKSSRINTKPMDKIMKSESELAMAKKMELLP